MIIKTWELDKNNKQYIFNYTENLNHLANEINQIVDMSPVTVEGIAEKLNDFYTVSGKVKVKLILECSRCLGSYEYILENEFSEIFIPNGIKINSDNDSDNENEYLLLDTTEIDLKPIVEEAVAIGMPYIPLCDKACKGLCSSCGTNLNLEPCNCCNEKIDPRLADLADWFDKN